MLDRAVLTGRVHRLEDDQHRVAVGRIEQLLRLGHVGDVLVEGLDRAHLQFVLSQRLEFAAAGPAWIVPFQVHPGARFDTESPRRFLVRQFHLCHSSVGTV